MPSTKKRAVGLHPEAHLRRARAFFIDLEGVAAAEKRAAEIAALPAVAWKGHTLRTVRCAAEFGQGPHLIHLPEAVLWSLFRLDHFVCPWHR